MSVASSTTYGDEKALIRACIRGEQGSWARFARQYQRLILGVVGYVRRRYAAYRCETDDMLGHVYERLLDDRCRRLRAWRGRARFSTYLVEVAKNLCMDYLKTHNKGACMEPWDDLLADKASPPLAVQEEEQAARVAALRNAIEKLPARQAMVIRLRLSGRTLRAIAVLLKLPEGTVFAENSRALETLRRLLVEHQTEQPPG